MPRAARVAHYVFRKVATFNQLQDLERQVGSLLRATFDAVVKVHCDEPFEVVSGEAELGHILGRSLEGQSILECAWDETEKEKLRALLEQESIGAREAAKRASSFWWKLMPAEPPEALAVAPMINTRLDGRLRSGGGMVVGSRSSTSSASSAKVSFDVEVMAVPQSFSSPTALLAVRLSKLASLEELTTASEHEMEEDEEGDDTLESFGFRPRPASPQPLPFAPASSRSRLIAGGARTPGTHGSSFGPILSNSRSAMSSRSTNTAETVNHLVAAANPLHVADEDSLPDSANTPPPTIFGATSHTLASRSATSRNQAGIFAQQLASALVSHQQDHVPDPGTSSVSSAMRGDAAETLQATSHQQDHVPDPGTSSVSSAMRGGAAETLQATPKVNL